MYAGGGNELVAATERWGPNISDCMDPLNRTEEVHAGVTGLAGGQVAGTGCRASCPGCHCRPSTHCAPVIQEACSRFSVEIHQTQKGYFGFAV